jgi:hypothetical protein
MMLGGMQDFELRVPRIINHAEREHGTREIVTWWADGTTTVRSFRRWLTKSYTGLSMDSPAANRVSWPTNNSQSNASG